MPAAVAAKTQAIAAPRECLSGDKHSREIPEADARGEPEFFRRDAPDSGAERKPWDGRFGSVEDGSLPFAFARAAERLIGEG